MLRFLWQRQQQRQSSPFLAASSLNPDLTSKFFPAANPPSILQPISNGCTQLRPIWLAIILHFFSPRFANPFSRLVVLFFPSIVQLVGGERYLPAAFLVTAVLEAILN